MSSANRGILKQDKAGRWYFTVDVASRGAPRQVVKRRGFVTKRAATAARSTILRTVASGEHVHASKPTVAECLDGWLYAQRAHLQPTTLSRYGRIIAIAKQGLGRVRLEALGAKDLDRFYAKLLTEGHQYDRTPKTVGGLSPRTVRNVHTILRRALEDACCAGIVVANAADLADLPGSSGAVVLDANAWTRAARSDDASQVRPSWTRFPLPRGRVAGLLGAIAIGVIATVGLGGDHPPEAHVVSAALGSRAAREAHPLWSGVSVVPQPSSAGVRVATTPPLADLWDAIARCETGGNGQMQGPQ